MHMQWMTDLIDAFREVIQGIDPATWRKLYFNGIIEGISKMLETYMKSKRCGSYDFDETCIQ